MRDITSSNTHHNGAKGGEGMVPTAPKFGGWWCSVRHAGRKEVRHGWTGFVTTTKKTTRTMAGFLFFTFFLQKWSRFGSTQETLGKARRAGLWTTDRSQFALSDGYGV